MLLVVGPSNKSVVVMGFASDALGAGSSGSWWGRSSQCWKMLTQVVRKIQAKSCLLLYSSNVSFAFFRLLAGSHESSSGPYPFHRIRKLHCPLLFRLWRTMWSTSYSSSLSIKSGGGRVLTLDRSILQCLLEWFQMDRME